MEIIAEFELLIAYIGQMCEGIEGACKLIEITATSGSVGLSSSMFGSLSVKGILMPLISAVSAYFLSRFCNRRFYTLASQLRDIMKTLKLVEISIDPSRTMTQLPENLIENILKYKEISDETVKLPCYGYLDFNVQKRANTAFVARAQCNLICEKLKKKIKDKNNVNTNHLKNKGDLILYVDHLFDYLGLVAYELDKL